MLSQQTPDIYFKQLLATLHQKEITILAHDNIDIDAALSGILLSRLLGFLEIKNTFKILEPIQPNETYHVIKELIGIDLKEFVSLSNSQSDNTTLFLVDHYKTSHLGSVLGYIDHHPTIQHTNVLFSYTKNSSATAYLIYELMQEAQYPITKQDALMIVTAMMADTVCFKSTKALPEEIEIAKQLTKSFNLDWRQIEMYALCPTPIEKMTLNEIITNGYKEYEFSGFKIASAYIQLTRLNDASTVEKWVQELAFNINFNTLKMYVFLVFDIENKKTYEYQITRECIKETIHYDIISRGKDVMPRIEKIFLNGRLSTELKIAEIIQTLSSSKKTIATMESCTGGQLASDITSVSNASEILHESYVTYCNEAKIKLGVPQQVITKHGVYSYETAISMANAVSTYANTNIGVGITGQLGRINPCYPKISDNQVWYAIYLKANNSYFTSKLFIIFDVSREQKKKIVTKQIIETLYTLLI